MNRLRINRANFCMFMVGLLLSSLVSAECTNRNFNIKITKPDSRYIDHGDGTVTDTVTELMWQKCTLGLSGNDCGTGVAESLTWQAALAVSNENSDYGYVDWRLPNINELASLGELACYGPAINETFFPAIPQGFMFWSSTPAYPDSAWSVYFYNGLKFSRQKNLANFTNTEYYVRLVRNAN